MRCAVTVNKLNDNRGYNFVNFIIIANGLFFAGMTDRTDKSSSENIKYM